MKTPILPTIGFILVSISILFTGCKWSCSADSEHLQAADAQLQKDLDMYVTVWNAIVNDGKIDLINETHFDEGITLVTNPENIVGIEAFKAYYNTFLTGFSDIEFTVVDAFGQGDKIAKHWRFKGKHSGDFFGIPPTGKEVSVQGVTLVKMKDGRILEEQDFMDNLAFMQQLGIIPRE